MGHGTRNSVSRFLHNQILTAGEISQVPALFLAALALASL